MKYQLMQNQCVKVNYNIMGEPVKKPITWGKRSRKRPRPRLSRGKTCSPPRTRGSHSCTNESAEKSHSHSTRVPSPPRVQSVPSFDSIRIFHVLREILFGKVLRDMMASHQSPLPDVLRFFCQTSFGVTTVAKKRQTGLFHAVLAQQGESSFFRVMKRLLHIPGIKPFDDKVAAVYFEVWCWLIQNDAIVEVGINGQIKVSLKEMLRCFHELSCAGGNHLSPMLLSGIKRNMESQRREVSTSLKASAKCAKQSECLLDVDDLLEKILNLIERFDRGVSELDKELFVYPETTVLVNEQNSTGKIRLNVGDGQNAHTQMKSVRSFLHDCIASDKTRQGVLQCDLFSSVVRQWYEREYGILAAPLKLIGDLINHFLITNEDADKVDYVSFAGVLYTFLLEDKYTVPGPEVLVSYMNQSYRGVDTHHLSCIQQYVENARLKSDHVEALSYRERVEQSRKTLSRIRPLGDFDFIAKWVVAPASKIEFEPIENIHIDHSPILSAKELSSSSEPSNCRPKTPLHIIEPHASLDKIESSVLKKEDTKVESIQKQSSVLTGEDTKANAIQKQETEDANQKGRYSKNIHIRFSGVVSYRLPLNDMEWNTARETRSTIIPVELVPVEKVESDQMHESDIFVEYDADETTRQNSVEVQKERIFEKEYEDGGTTRGLEDNPRIISKRLNMAESTKNCHDRKPGINSVSTRIRSLSFTSSPKKARRKKTSIISSTNVLKDTALDDPSGITSKYCTPEIQIPLEEESSPSSPVENGAQIVFTKNGFASDGIYSQHIEAVTEIHEGEATNHDKYLIQTQMEGEGGHWINTHQTEAVDEILEGKVNDDISLIYTGTEGKGEHLIFASPEQKRNRYLVSDSIESISASKYLCPSPSSKGECIILRNERYGPEKPPLIIGSNSTEVNLDKFLTRVVDQIPRFTLKLDMCSTSGIIMSARQFFLLQKIMQKFATATNLIMKDRSKTLEAMQTFGSIIYKPKSKIEFSTKELYVFEDEWTEEDNKIQTMPSLQQDQTFVPVIERSKIVVNVESKDVTDNIERAFATDSITDESKHGTDTIDRFSSAVRVEFKESTDNIEQVTSDLVKIMEEDKHLCFQFDSISVCHEKLDGLQKNILTLKVGNIHLTSSYDWKTMFLGAENSLLDEVSSFLLLQNHNREMLLINFANTTSKKGRKTMIEDPRVGVRSLLIKSRGRKVRRPMTAPLQKAPHSRLRPITPIVYKIR